MTAELQITVTPTDRHQPLAGLTLGTGDYAVVLTDPCVLAATQAHRNGTHVLTIKGTRPGLGRPTLLASRAARTRSDLLAGIVSPDPSVPVSPVRDRIVAELLAVTRAVLNEVHMPDELGARLHAAVAAARTLIDEQAG